jgi:SAM-dependent methyltransferase
MDTQEIRNDWRDELLAKYYPQKPGRLSPWDEWVALAQDYLPKDAKVLEVGGGPEECTTRLLRERAREIVGLDVDPVVRNNRLLDEAIVYAGGEFPLPGNRFDIVISRWVNEHLSNPGLHFREIQRVLVPGGLYIFRTVNIYHYTALVSCLTPHWIHVKGVKWLKHLSSEHYDAYRTFYRANTRRRISALFKEAGLEPVILRISEFYPRYGMGSRGLFYAFMLYERLVNASSRFEDLRHTIDCVAKKSPSDVRS